MLITVGFGILLGVAKVLKINDTKVKLITGLTGWKAEQKNMFLNNCIIEQKNMFLNNCIIGNQRLHLVFLNEAIAQK